ncbi:uncharacterized protein LOC131891468 [Tigriopus californicus]|uniref:uncharacterized protein LOC131891468 n=1 Tax=Tigriopus californicus TaxID=6832 RepID=UPI0027DA1E2B|nr:uncharacterized protein LOC131891468 [Tigriopus californicus]
MDVLQGTFRRRRVISRLDPSGLASASNPTLSPTMDLLVKSAPGPDSLESLACECLADYIVSLLARRQPGGGPKGNFPAMEHALIQNFQSWISQLISPILPDVLAIANVKLRGLLDRTQPDHVTLLPILISTLLEMMYRQDLKGLVLEPELQWHKDSRSRVLHLIHLQESGLQSLSFKCYQAPLFHYETLQFSERYILLSCFYRLSKLHCLTLPNVCDDEILAYIGLHCPLLTYIDIQGSLRVTNQGVSWFLFREDPPQSPISFHPSHLNLDDSLKSKIFQKSSPISRPGFRPTPMTAAMLKPCPQKRNQLKRIKSWKLRDTGITHAALKAILQDCSGLHVLEANEKEWIDFIEASAEATMSYPGIRDIHLSIRDSQFLKALSKMFPNLQFLHVFSPLPCSQELLTLDSTEAYFPKCQRISMRNAHLCHPRNIWLGQQLTNLEFKGQQHELNLDVLAEQCPHLQQLSVFEGRLSHQGPIEFPQLTHLKVWNIDGKGPLSLLICSAPQLEALFLWNVVVTDSDLSVILSKNPLQELREFRIASSEIGFVRLTEESALRLIQSCPKLSVLGGICDWNTSDLLTFLHKLLISGGWKMILEAI